jgi:hypothetical protein
MSLDSGIRNVLSNMSIIQNNINELEAGVDTKQDAFGALSTIIVNEVKANTITLAGTKISTKLAAKQDVLTTSCNITTGTISSGKITGRDLAVLDFPTIYGSVIQASTLIYGTGTNVASEISGLYSTVSNKQTALGSNVNITTGIIGAGNITGRTGTTITAPIITASGNLLYGTTNVATKITELETTKQNTLNASSDITVGTIDSGNIIGRLRTSINSANIIGTNVFMDLLQI